MTIDKERAHALDESGTSGQGPGSGTLYGGRPWCQLPWLLSSPLAGLPHKLLLLLLFILMVPATPVSAFNFNGFWLYREAGGDDIPTRREYQQRYTLGVGGALVYQPTHAITASAAIGYTGNRTDSGEGFNDRNELTPTARLGLVNDIFGAHISANSVIRWVEAGQTNETSWDASLASRWVIPLWPSVRFSYGESNDPTEGFNFFEKTGVKEKTAGFNLTWDLILADFIYNWSSNTSENDESRFFAENISHFAKIETGGVFWDNRFRFNFSQQVLYNDSNITIDEESGGFVDVPLAGQSFAKVDLNLESDPDPTDPLYQDPEQPLPPNAVVNIEERVQLRFASDSSFPEQIDILRLTLADSFSVPQALELRWQLYTRSETTGLWEFEDVIQGESVPEEESRIDLPVALNTPELLVVAVNDSSMQLIFTNLEALTRVTSNTYSSTNSYLTNLGMGYRITESLRAAAFLVLEHNETETLGASSDSDRQGLSGSLRWSPSPLISPSLNFSEYRDQLTDQPDTRNRTYALTVATHPMPRLDVSFGSTRNERYIGDQKTFSTDRFNLSTKALIYPDLTADWYLTYSESETLVEEGLYRDSTSFSSSLEFNAQLYRDLSADFLTSYINTENDNRSNESASARLSLHYRPSDLLSLRGTYATFFLDSDASDELGLNLALTLLRTDKTRLVFNALHNQAETRIDTFGLNGSWTISRYFTMLARGNYRVAARNAYSFQVSLSFRL